MWEAAASVLVREFRERRGIVYCKIDELPTAQTGWLVVEGLRETPPMTRVDLWVESVDQMVFRRGERSSEGRRGVGFIEPFAVANERELGVDQ